MPHPGVTLDAFGICAIRGNVFNEDRRWAGAFLLTCAAAWAPLAAVAQWNPPNPVVSFEKQSNGVEIRQKNGVLQARSGCAGCAARHLLAARCQPRKFAPSDHVVIKKDWPAASFDVTANEKAITLTTSKLKAVVEREAGALHYVGPGRQAADHRGLSLPEAGRGEWREDLSCRSVFPDLWIT